MINRCGTKRQIASKIIPLFPEHKTYIEMFFGGGGMFFQKPPAQYNIVNDLDDDVFNLFQVIRYDYEKLIELMQMMPRHQSFFANYNNSARSEEQAVASEAQAIQPYFQSMERDNIMRAARFLFVVSYGLYGGCSTMKFNVNSNIWEVAIKKVRDVYRMLTSGVNVLFMCCDFREVLNRVAFRTEREKQSTFIYADPPYLTGGKHYKTAWTLDDTVDLFDILVVSGIRFALSEFDSPSILDIAKQHDLRVNYICERKNIKNRRTEILVTNYDLPLW